MTLGAPARSVGSASRGRGAILVLYYARNAPLRASVADHLYSMGRYSGRRCIYVNLAVRRLPRWIDRLGIELVVFHTLLLATRWHRPMLERVVSRLQPVKRLECPKVAMPQDEYIHTDALAALIREFAIDQVLTCAPDSELRKIYGDLVDGPTRFTRVMTGYLEPETVRRIEGLGSSVDRRIDIGYRAYDPEPSLGRHGRLKSEIGRVFKLAGDAAALTTDISLRAEDTLLADDWYRFLLECRWVVGVEGGASVLDRDGTYIDCSRAYVRANPGASFEEVEAACFPGADGSLAYAAISPRHLEACVTRTGQVLVEGTYNGVLEPGLHYVPVRPDFSDLSDAIAAIRDEETRRTLVARAYDDIVASGQYTYPSFVRGVLESAPGEGVPGRRPAELLTTWEGALDRPSWWVVRVWARTRRLARSGLARLGLLDLARGLRSRARD